MLFSGFSKRSIPDQSGQINFLFNVSLNNSSGSCLFGLSGTNMFQFKVESGKIYDNVNNFVGSYGPNSTIALQGCLNQSSYDYSINNHQIAANNPISGGTYAWIFVKPANVTVDFRATINGDLPDYSIETSGHYRFAGDIVSGKIINNSLGVFRIFDAHINVASSYSVTGFTTGDISNTGYFLLTNNGSGVNNAVLPISIETNFGAKQINFAMKGDL